MTLDHALGVAATRHDDLSRWPARNVPAWPTYGESHRNVPEIISINRRQRHRAIYFCADKIFSLLCAPLQNAAHMTGATSNYRGERLTMLSFKSSASVAEIASHRRHHEKVMAAISC